jgi:Tfp pilus assembly protein PilO
MKSTDRTILLVLAAVGLVAGIWFLLIAPKRDEASTLSQEVADLEIAVQQAEDLASAAELAKADYAENYHHMVVLGKAAPAEDDTASLFVQFDELAGASGVDLQSIDLVEGSAGAEPQTAAEQTTADETEAEGEPAAEPTAAATPPPTEASAALLPLGATIGPAGLPIMPYELALKGDYFEIADFVNALQKLVHGENGAGTGTVDGRLVTINSFSFTGDEADGFPALDATLKVTTYLAPDGQGLTGGTTPTAPPATTDTTSTTSTTTTP